MSTRSATIVRQRTHSSSTEYTVEELFRFYRHCDGYPEGHGLDMATAFLAAEQNDMPDPDDGFGWMKPTLNNRNWVQHCFKYLFNMNCDLEVEPKGTEHGDIEYLYVVEGRYDRYGGKHGAAELPVNIAVYSIGWDTHYEDAMAGEPIFSGTPSEYIAEFGKAE